MTGTVREEAVKLRQNLDKVYDAGYVAATEAVDSILDSFTESGPIVVCEPLEGYPLSVQTEAGATKVMRTGKNLFDDVAFYQANGFTLQDDGYWRFNPLAQGLMYENTAGLQGQFTVSLQGYLDDTAYNGVIILFDYTDGTNIYYGGRNDNNFLVYTTDASKVVSRISLTRNCGVTTYYSYIKDIQIEYGATATPYEPYNGGEFNVGETIPALSGVNTIWADRGEITVTGKSGDLYEAGKQAEYDRFWDVYQDYGNRINYQYGAFAGIGWTDETYKPKYPIKVKHCLSMYSGCLMTEIKDVDFSSAETGDSVFQACNKLKYIGVVNVPLLTRLYGMFGYCYVLETIENFTVGENCVFNNMTFYECRALKNITMGGTIGYSIYFQQSPLLTTESVQSIIDHLKDLTGATAQTLTLHSTVFTNLTSDQLASIFAKNWTVK